jgi:KDO2-lipid IV(A) lauroyltransferase
MRYKLSHIVEYGLLRFVAGLVNLLPYRAALALGCGLAKISFLILRKKMKKTRRRLIQVFGTRFNDQELNGILWRAWRNLIFNAIESLRTPSVTLEWLRKVIDTTEFHRVTDNLKDGRGAVLAVSHMGNWELAGIAVQMLGVNLMAVVRSQKNPLTNAYLNRMREYTGVEAILKEAKAFGGVIRKMREGHCLAILPDVRAKTQAIEIEFLGTKTQIPRGMALFAREAGVPIISGCLTRKGWARHSWKVFDPVWPDPQADKDADILRMTQQVMANFDQAIREYPDQYFWFNGRWVLGEEKKD